VDVAARLRRRWRARTGPKGPIKLTASLSRRIAGLDAAGATLLKIASLTGVSTATVRVALGRVAPASQAPLEPDVGLDEPRGDAEDADLVVLAAPEPRTTERVAARFGDLVEAPVVITEGAQLPLAGLLLALPALEMTGLVKVATETFPPMRKGFYGLRAVLLMGVFLALLREPRAEAATRITGRRRRADNNRSPTYTWRPPVCWAHKRTRLVPRTKSPIHLKILSTHHCPRVSPNHWGINIIASVSRDKHS
jgi:hypothetical protein